MIRYNEFEDAVKQVASDFDEWRHLLPSIPIAFRRRYMQTMEAGFDMCVSFDYVMSSATLNEEAYTAFLEIALQRSPSFPPHYP